MKSTAFDTIPLVLGERAFLVLRFLVVVMMAIIVTVLALPAPTTSAAWTPPEAPTLHQGFEPNGELETAERLVAGQVVGPESIAIDAEGRIYSGTTDGKIIRLRPDAAGSTRSVTSSVEVFTETGGRPLGMRFSPTGDLIVADAMKGLLRVDPTGAVEVLAHGAEGAAFHFLNDVVIAASGVIYMTDSSFWRYGDQFFDVVESIPSGRVIRYDPPTRVAVVIARGLAFANGIALAPDESYLLVTESARYRIARVWLQGDKRHLLETFVDNLPGFPDNISLSPRGTWWVAMFSVREPVLDLLHPFPFVKDTLAGLPDAVRPRHRNYGLVFEMDATGKPLRSFHDATGKRMRDVSSAVERDGSLYLGTLTGTAIGRVQLDGVLDAALDGPGDAQAGQPGGR